MPIKRTVHDLLDEIGTYELTDAHWAIDCQDGETGLAFERGWEAAMVEVRAAVEKIYPRTTKERDA